VSEILSWSLECPRCGAFRVSNVDRAVLLGYPAPSSLLPPSAPAASPAPAWCPAERMHLVSGYLRELTIAGQGGLTITPENSRTMVEAAPRAVPDRTNRLLLNLAGLSGFAGDRIQIFAESDYPLAYASNGQELMSQLHYLSRTGSSTGPR
jgi:hypothetical protein